VTPGRAATFAKIESSSDCDLATSFGCAPTDRTAFAAASVVTATVRPPSNHMPACGTVTASASRCAVACCRSLVAAASVLMPRSLATASVTASF
jgi:hypothetical protein